MKFSGKISLALFLAFVVIATALPDPQGGSGRSPQSGQDAGAPPASNGGGSGRAPGPATTTTKTTTKKTTTPKCKHSIN